MKKLSIACLALTVSLPIFAYGYESSNDFTFTEFVTIVAGVLQAILFLKIWGATNDIRKIKEHLEPSELMQSDLRILHFSGHHNQAVELLNKRFFKSVDIAFSNCSNSDRFPKILEKVIEKYKPMYDALGEEVPESITSITSYEQYKKFGKK